MNWGYFFVLNKIYLNITIYLYIKIMNTFRDHYISIKVRWRIFLIYFFTISQIYIDKIIEIYVKRYI